MTTRVVARASGEAALDHSRVPVVIEGAERLDVEALVRDHGAAPVRTVTVIDGHVAIDVRRGLVATNGTLGAALEAIRRGDGSRYVMTPLEELPPPLRDRLAAHAEPARPATRKLWISAAGTVSALHFDVPRNVHAVLAGAKRFTLFPPRASLRLYPRGPFDGIPNGAFVDPERPDLDRYPRFVHAHPWAVDVRAGESILIPSGWWHHVRTLEPTIAVNAWWSVGLARGVAKLADFYKRFRGVSR